MKPTAKATLAVLALLAFTATCRAQRMGFGGPSILSRAGAPVGRSGGRAIGFRPYVSVMARYDTDLGSLADGQQGSNHSGGDASWGIYGVRKGARNVIGLNYSGNYRYYTHSGRQNGTSHFASLNFAQQVSPRTEVFVSAGGSSYSYVWIGQRTPLIADPFLGINDPADEGFDNRTNALTGSGGLRHMLTDRLSVGLAGRGFSVRRQDKAFVDLQGYSVSGNVGYQLSRTQSIGGSYNYSYYFFPGGFGNSLVHSVHLDYMHRLSPEWNLSLGVGAYRVESQRLVRVAVDPILAAITGQNAALEAYHGTSYGPSVQATLARRFERATLSFYYRRGVSPGNSFLMTSAHENGGVHYSYTATQRLNIGFDFTARRYSSLTQGIGRYTNVGGGVSMGYRLWRFLHFTMHARMYRWGVGNSDFERDRLSVAAGLSFSPGETPLSLW